MKTPIMLMGRRVADALNKISNTNANRRLETFKDENGKAVLTGKAFGLDMKITVEEIEK